MWGVMAVVQTVSGRHMHVQQPAAPRRSGCTWDPHANRIPLHITCCLPNPTPFTPAQASAHWEISPSDTVAGRRRRAEKSSASRTVAVSV